MRHPVYRLATEGAGRPELQPTGRRSWRRLVVVAREACVFEQLPCAGVAWHERRGFARLQALRLAPYAATGASAAIRNGRLMLWLWDKDEVDSAIAASGFDPARVSTIAETLLLPVPRSSGAAELSAQGGIDHVQLDRGAIVASRWEGRRRGRATAAPELPARPWATDLLQRRWYAAGAGGIDLRRQAVIAGWLLAAFSAAHSAYWAGSWWSLQQQADARSRAPSSSDSELAAVARARADEREDRAWLQHYRRLSASLRIRALLDALERPLEANRLVIKELEAHDDDLRLTLAAVGSDIDLPGVLLALQRVPGIEAVQLRQNADTLQATYTMRPAGFRQPIATPGAAR